MNVHEHQAKDLFRKYGVPVPKNTALMSPEGAKAAAQKLIDETGNEYVVESGLSAGDRLIVSGIQKIGDGAPVTPMPASAADAPAGER